MITLAESEFRNSGIGELHELPSSGSALENPYVYDASARELKVTAERQLVEITDEKRDGDGPDALITKLAFRRLR